MKKEDVAWAAGIIDGEGCISIVRCPPSKRNGCLTLRHTLHLKVTMGHKPTVERLLRIFKIGTIQNHVPCRKNVNASFSYWASARKAGKVLKLARKFLVTRAKEADVALKFLKLKTWQVGGRNGNTKTPKWLILERDKLYWKLRKLKSRWRFYLNGRYHRRGKIIGKPKPSLA